MSNPKVSIIVPIYNAESYLRKCVDSLLNQSYDNVELLLVDDGSSDDSAAICDGYAIESPSITVIHKQNGGLSDARNAGLDNCTGSLIMFVDADDYLAPTAVEVLVQTRKDTEAWLVQMKSYIVNSDYSIRFNQSNNTSSVSIVTSEDYIDGICHKRMSESVCDKLFPREAFINHRFVKGRLNEDFLFLSRLMMDSFLVAIIDFPGYYYYQRKGSISHSGFGKSLVDSVANGYDLVREATVCSPQSATSFIRYTLFQIRTLLIDIPWTYVKENSEEYCQSLYCLNELRGTIDNTDLSFIDKLFLKSVIKHPKASVFIFKVMFKLKNLI